MKMNLDCIPCFQRQALKAVRMNIQDEKIHESILRQVMECIIGLDWSLTPPELAHNVHRIIREGIGIEDPYREAKKNCNELALKLLPRIKERIDGSPDPLGTAIRISIAGNIMDFGPAGGNFNVEKTIGEILGKRFAIDDYQDFKKELRSAKNILFFTDNAGEIAFDRVLIETILDAQKKNGLEKPKITVAVKGGPIINDATMQDAKYVGMDRIPGVEFKETNNGDPGTGPVRNSKEVESWIRNHDVTISKGQGNYEGLSQFKNIFFMLIAKCNVIASNLGVKEGDAVLKYTK